MGYQVGGAYQINVWDLRYRIKIMLSTNLRSSWERGRGNMIFSENLAVDVN